MGGHCNNDGPMFRILLSSYLSSRHESVHFWHLKIGQDQIWFQFLNKFKCLNPIPGIDDI